MRRPLCPLPFTHLFINNAGIVNACCLTYPQYAQKDEFGGDQSDRSVLKVGLLAAWNSSYTRNFRRQMDEQQWPKTCATCLSQEQAGHKSRRLLELDSLPSAANNVVSIRTMDLRIGNVCNLACRMCSPFSSAALYKEWKASGTSASKVMSDSINAYDKIDWRNWSELPEIWEEIFKVSSSVEEINFAGGEPFLNLAHVNYLQHLVDSKLSRKIGLSYNTNLTRIPTWLEPMLKEFKSIRIMVSIDGIGQLGELIRYPLNWRTFESNLAELDLLKHRHPEKLEVAFNTTVQAYNVFGLIDLVDYLAKSPFENLPRTTFANFVQNPSYFNAANLPSEIKLEAHRKIADFIRSHSNHESLNFLRAALQQLETPGSEDVTDSFRRVTKFYDRQRDQNFPNLVPEMRHLFI